MEFPKEIEKWLSTIPVRRREGFVRYVKRDLFLLFNSNYSKEEFNKILEKTKTRIIKYMNENDDENRRHGSKGKKHRERGVDYISGIEERINKYGIDYVSLFKEVFDVELKEKNDGYLGLCPIHKENTPSLSINVHKGVIKCYGCGIAGSNIVNFIRNSSSKYDKKSIGRIYSLIEKYILDPDESKEYYAYWSNNTKMKFCVNPLREGDKNDVIDNDVDVDSDEKIDDLPF